MTDKKKGFSLDVALERQRAVLRVMRELSKGFEKDIIPHHYIGFGGFVISILFWRSKFFLFHLMPASSKCIVVTVILGGYILWAGRRIHLLNRFLKDLTETFENAGLRTTSGRLPSFISDRAVDANCRVMTLNSNKVSNSSFQSAKDKLESGFFGYIDKIEENRVTGVVKIFYSEEDFPEVIDLDSPFGRRDFSFVVGNTRSGIKVINLIDVPHLLVAGTSNAGKSTFLKLVIATLYLNNNDAEFVLIDLKFGLESIEFKDLPRMIIHKTNQAALHALVEIETELKERGQLLYNCDCKNILEYNEKARANGNDPKKPTEHLKRKIVIIDEAAQIFLAGPDMTAGDVAQARGVVSTLAAQGRAVGINLILATQRPDVNIIDGSIKANLQGRVCFHMSDNATSMTILDSVRAADLPDIKGRAIFRNGPELIELQVPQLDDQRLREFLKPLKIIPSPQTAAKSREPNTASANLDEIQKGVDA